MSRHAPELFSAVTIVTTYGETSVFSQDAGLVASAAFQEAARTISDAYNYLRNRNSPENLEVRPKEVWLHLDSRIDFSMERNLSDASCRIIEFRKALNALAGSANVEPASLILLHDEVPFNVIRKNEIDVRNIMWRLYHNLAYRHR